MSDNDIRSLGQRGQVVFDHANKLKGAGAINDAEFKELTNSNVNNQDVAIVNRGLDRLKGHEPGAVDIARNTLPTNDALLGMQRDQLGGTLKDLGKTLAQPVMDFINQALGMFGFPIAAASGTSSNMQQPR